MSHKNSSPWKVVVTRKGYGGRQQSQTHFMGHADLKRCTRWVHILSTPSQITNIRVVRSDKYSLKPSDSYRVTLKIKCVTELEMGSISCATPMIDYNPKAYLQQITDKKVYCKVWIYDSLPAEKRGISATNAYQSAADQYNVFMSELSEIWREQMVETFIKEQIIETKTCNKDEECQMDEFYKPIRYGLHRRCKNTKTNPVWDDMQSAFEKAFGSCPMDKNAPMTPPAMINNAN